MTARSAKSAKSGAKRVCGSTFQPDPDVPADPLTGAQFCRCGLAGQAGDAHHPPLPDAPVDDVQRRAAGERGDR